jgi:hypothetical protein
MRMGLIALGALVVLFSNNVAQAALTVEQRLSDYHQLVSTIERYYGPLKEKEKTIGLNWGATVREFEGNAIAAQNDAEFYQVLAKFLNALKDSHVSSMVPSTYRARLGFLCDYVEGKVLIDQIDTLRLPEELFPFKKGDRLVSIDGVPVEKLMKEIASTTDTGYEGSQNRISAAYLTSRREAVGLAVPRGNAFIQVLPKGAAKPITVVLTWITSGQPVVDLDDLAKLVATSTTAFAQSMANLGEEKSTEELVKNLSHSSIFNLTLPKTQLQNWASAGVADIGAAKSMFDLPAGSEQIQGVPVTAVIYEAMGKKIGILRLPSYGTEDLLAWAAQAVIKMEQETDVMVLDQTNNPGGSVSLVSEIASLFMRESAKDMLFEIRPSLRWVEAFAGINQKLAEMLAADPKDAGANALKARFQYLEEEMRDAIAKRKFLSAPVSLNLGGTYGVIQPQPTVSYSKPVLMLINEYDWSGGDAFPAIMRDNGRVTLFGNRTSGAGGNVEEYGPLANSYFKFSLTESLMIRPNGEYIENRGVSPDIAYSVTEEDFMNGYKNYVRNFTVEALKLIGVNTTVDELVKEEQAKAKATSNK